MSARQVQLCLALCFLAPFLGEGRPVSAQTVPGAIPPVEMTADVVNGEVLCRPQRARLPAERLLDLRVVNRSERPITFAAPKFFAGTRHVETTGATWDLSVGSFTAAPNASVRVLLRTPPTGEYPFSCYEPSEVPTPASSGFLVVVPAAPPS